MARNTTPESLYGNSRDMLREAERENEILAEIAGEEYESPGNIPNGKYVIEKRLLDAAQKKNELLEEIAEAGPGGGSSAAKAIGIDYGTDIISLKNKDGETIQGSGATLPAYGVTFDPATGGLTLTKNGTAVQGQTVTIPNYGSPVGVDSSADMTDHDKIYLYLGTTGGGLTNGHFYYWDGAAWADGGEYAAATVQTDKTLLVENRAADAKATGDAVAALKTHLMLTENAARIDEVNVSGWMNANQGFANDTLSANANRLTTGQIYRASDGIIYVHTNQGYSFTVVAYDSDNTYIGLYRTNGTFTKGNEAVAVVTEWDLTKYPTYGFRFIMRNSNSPNSSLPVSESVNMLFRQDTSKVNSFYSRTESLQDVDVYSTSQNFSLSANGIALAGSSSFSVVGYEVHEGDKLFLKLDKPISLRGTSLATYQWQTIRLVATAEPNTALVGQPVTGAVNGYVTVPQGAKFLIVCQLNNKVDNIVKWSTSIPKAFCNRLNPINKSSKYELVADNYITSTEYHNSWGDLLTSYSDFLTRHQIGTANDLPIYLYRLNCTPKILDSSYNVTTGQIYEKKKVLVLGCQHSNERGSCLFIQSFVKNILENEDFSAIAGIYDFYFVPIVNPWGYNHSIVYSATGTPLWGNGEGASSGELSPGYEVVENTSENGYCAGVRNCWDGYNFKANPNRDWSDTTYPNNGVTYGFQLTETQIVRDLFIGSNPEFPNIKFDVCFDVHQAPDLNASNNVCGFANMNVSQNDSRFATVNKSINKACIDTIDIANKINGGKKTTTQIAFPWDGISALGMAPNYFGGVSVGGHGNTLHLESKVDWYLTIESSLYCLPVSGSAVPYNHIANIVSNIFTQQVILNLLRDIT